MHHDAKQFRPVEMPADDPARANCEGLTREPPLTVADALLGDGKSICGIGIFVIDAETRVIELNHDAERIFDFEFPGLRGIKLADRCEPDETGLPEMLAAAKSGLPASRCDFRIAKSVDKESWISLSVNRAMAGSDDHFIVTAVDVTARRRSEDGLRQIVESALNAIVLVDVSGVITSVNAQTERMFGYPRRRLVGAPVEMLVPDRFRGQHADSRQRYFSAPAVRPMGAGRDLYGRRSDGTEFPVEIGLSPISSADGPRVLASIVDITERQRAERRFRLAVESAPNANVMINRDGRIVLVNRQTEELFGYTREELLGELVEILVPERFRLRHPQDRDAFLARPSVRAMGAGRELYGRRKDGSEFPIEIGLNPIETGEETLVLSAIVDITARKEAEARVRRHLADLAHVARLSTVGQMFSELAHEINQPLAAAANYARACVAFAKSGQAISQEQLLEWMEKTAAQTTRAIDIVKRLGSFVKKDGGVRSQVDVNELVEHVVRHSVPAIQTSIDGAPAPEIRVDLHPSLPQVFADRVQIEQVLLNLIRNAVDAMQDQLEHPPQLALRTSHDARFVVIQVADNGPGITPANLPRLFDAYFTTKPAGMGLGLSISRSIADDHGGNLTVETSPSGTTFSITLPIPSGFNS
jgi:PAS domain S-box-containing protein